MPGDALDHESAVEEITPTPPRSWVLTHRKALGRRDSSMTSTVAPVQPSVDA